MKITFTNTINVPNTYRPQPSSKYIPQWYKDTKSFIDTELFPGTIKKCMPVFDSLTSGYIIPSPCDVIVKQVQVDNQMQTTKPEYLFKDFDIIQFHSIDQAPNYPSSFQHKETYPKWNNPWAIKTPPGYSVMIMQPTHRDSVFTIFPGVVDTDVYNAPIQFPFMLNDPNSFEGLIPAGTPIAQIVPFKRDNWEMALGENVDLVDYAKTIQKLRLKRYNSYKNQFRQEKRYS